MCIENASITQVGGEPSPSNARHGLGGNRFRVSLTQRYRGGDFDRDFRRDIRSIGVKNPRTLGQGDVGKVRASITIADR